MIAALIYVTLIAGVNWAFAVIPMVELPGGDLWSPAALIVGFVFVVRDFAQRAIGHKVLLAMLVGCLISWYMASPALAIASAGAFAIGELADWSLYTFTQKPFSQRILYSSLLGAPMDSIFFLSFIGIASPISIGSMTASKLVGAFIVFMLVRRREQMALARQETA